MSKMPSKPSSDDEAEQLVLIKLDDLAFDEMNLVETPFCLLTKTNNGITSIPLSPNGKEYLQVISERGGLPTALARRAVLGLLWLTKNQNNFQNRTIKFSIRELVENFMYPGKFTKYRASGKLLKSTEDELHRVANTRVRSSRWFDKKLGKVVDMDASIIDYVSVTEQGGKNLPRMLEMAWGTKVFESVQHRYTKDFDIRTWMQISHPIDEALYRWLDRQLHGDKTTEYVKSCQNFARFKLGMQGKVIERGGRTASGYIVNKFEEAIERMDCLGFKVRMTVEKTQDDFSLRFDKIMAKTNDVVHNDQVAELVYEFFHQFHNRPRNAKKCRLRRSDRNSAEGWIEDFGFEKSIWMVQRCKHIHDKSWRSKQQILYFAGLDAYKEAAAAEYEFTKQEEIGQLAIEFTESRKNKWGVYKEAMIQRTQRSLNDLEMQKIRNEAEVEIIASEEYAFMKKFEASTKITIDCAVSNKIFERSNPLSEEEFMSYESDEALQKALIHRHGINPLV